MRKYIVLAIVVLVSIVAMRSYILTKAEGMVREIPAVPQDCKYPERSTNTETTCDNSDPCDPSNAVKGGDGSCSSVEVTPTPVQEPIVLTEEVIYYGK